MHAVSTRRSRPPTTLTLDAAASSPSASAACTATGRGRLTPPTGCGFSRPAPADDGGAAAAAACMIGEPAARQPPGRSVWSAPLHDESSGRWPAAGSNAFVAAAGRCTRPAPLPAMRTTGYTTTTRRAPRVQPRYAAVARGVLGPPLAEARCPSPFHIFEHAEAPQRHCLLKGRVCRVGCAAADVIEPAAGWCASPRLQGPHFSMKLGRVVGGGRGFQRVGCLVVALS